MVEGVKVVLTLFEYLKIESGGEYFGVWGSGDEADGTLSLFHLVKKDVNFVDKREVEGDLVESQDGDAFFDLQGR